MIDAIRAIHPHLGLAVYAYEPGGPVTVEVLAQDGSRFTKQAPTMDEALADMFGLAQDEQQPEQSEEPDDDVFS